MVRIFKIAASLHSKWPRLLYEVQCSQNKDIRLSPLHIVSYDVMVDRLLHILSPFCRRLYRSTRLPAQSLIWPEVSSSRCRPGSVINSLTSSIRQKSLLRRSHFRRMAVFWLRARRVISRRSASGTPWAPPAKGNKSPSFPDIHLAFNASLLQVVFVRLVVSFGVSFCFASFCPRQNLQFCRGL